MVIIGRLVALAVVLASLVAVLPARAASVPEAAQPGTTVSVGFVSLAAQNLPFMVADSIGAFTQEGLTVDASVVGTSPLIMAAVIGGSLDIGVPSMDAHIRAVERGGNVSWFMSQFAPPIYGLLARPNITSYADLRGQTIMVDTPGGTTFYFTRRMLSQAGLSPDDYNLVFAAATPDRLSALVAGGVAAAMLLQPFDFAAERQGYPRLGNSNEVVRDYEFVGYTARPDWLRSNEATVARFIRGYVAGQRWLYDSANKERAIQVLSERTRQTSEDARATYELYVERERSFPLGGRVNPAGVQGVLDALVYMGEMTAPTPPISKYVDPTYVERYGQ